jgi:hypothetical protein
MIRLAIVGPIPGSDSKSDWDALLMLMRLVLDPMSGLDSLTAAPGSRAAGVPIVDEVLEPAN